MADEEAKAPEGENEEKPAEEAAAPPPEGEEAAPPPEGEGEAKPEGEETEKPAEEAPVPPPEEAAEEPPVELEVAKETLTKPKSARVRPTTAVKPAEEPAAPAAEAPAEPDVPSTDEPVTYEISISCKNLKNKDFLSKSDPLCVVFRRYKCADWEEVGRTETIQDDLNPVFANKVIFETNKPDQLLRFVVYDVDKPDSKLRAQDGLGSTEAAISEAQADGSLDVELKDISNEKMYGMLHLCVEKIDIKTENIVLDLAAKGIKGSGLFAPKAIVLIYRKRLVGDEYNLIWRSEEFKGKESNWAPFTLPEWTFCQGDRKRDIKIEVFVNKSLFGTAKTSLDELLAKTGKKGEIKIDGADKASLIVNECKVVP